METFTGFILLFLATMGAKNCLDRIIGSIVYHKAKKRKNIDLDNVSK